LLIAADIATLAVANLTLDTARNANWWGSGFSSLLRAVFQSGYLHAGHFGLAVIIGLAVTGNYGKGDHRHTGHKLLLGIALGAGLQLWPSLWTQPPAIALTRYIATVLALGLVFVVSRHAIDVVAKRVLRRRPGNARAILVGRASDCDRMMQRPGLAQQNGFEVRAIITTDSLRQRAPHAVHPLDELEYWIHNHAVDTALICGFPGEEVVTRTMRAAMSCECQVLSWNPTFDVTGAVPSLAWRNKSPFLEWRAPALRWWQMVAKRALDASIATTALLILSPVLVIIAVAVKLDSPGPAVFGQPRLGRFGRVFKCYKFRSMFRDAEERLLSDESLHAEYVRNDFKLPPNKDARITRIGRFLRKTSLDELPQLWNVLKGEMSLVGPRPIVPPELHHYQKDELLFLSLKPGMTGAWQVNGRSSVAYPERTNIELEYVQGWSLASDMGILLRTIPAVFQGRGAH
jgi:exopolysaccharide biosynthesis polyprenyl glycosylphosphotransferase